MAELLGGAPAAPAAQPAPDGATFLYADPSCSFFGEEVDDQLVGSEDTTVARESVCLVKRNNEWTMAERVVPRDKFRRSCADVAAILVSSRLLSTPTRSTASPRFGRRLSR